MDRACRSDLTSSELKTLMAVLNLTATYSKLDDEVYVPIIAGIANVHPTTARKALKRLTELGIARFEGRRGRGTRSKISLPPATPEVTKSTPTTGTTETTETTKTPPTTSRPSVCAECEVGQGLHSVDCPSILTRGAA
jgi:hypothetical protein